jgi:peptide/nickel transport system permease protein
MGPYITPYSYDETLYNDEGEVLRAESPSLSHPLGTTNTGQDVLSRVIYGVQPTVVTGLLGGAMIISIGLTMGVVSGYVGGLVDNVLMRITDIAYSVPLIPFAIVLLTLLGVGFYSSVVVIGLLLWRGNARVLRSQVLQIKQRPFVRAAKATGASTPRIIVKHILPNVASMAVLFFALGIGYSIIAQAGLAFIGASNPFVPSWGVMIRNAYQSGYMAEQIGWSLIPGLLISMTVLSAFLIGRGFEQDDKAFGEAG